MLKLSIVIIEPLATAQHYYPKITDLLECKYEYQQQGIINSMKSMDSIMLGIMKVYYNERNKFLKRSKYTSKSILNVDTIR